MKKRFYVFFTKAIRLPWYFSKLDNDMSHCFTLEHQTIGGFDCFVRVENLTNLIETSIYLVSYEDIINLIEMQHDYRTILIDVEVNPAKTMNPLIHMNCAGLVKKSLGVNRPLVITPKQLFNHLLSMGGKEI